MSDYLSSSLFFGVTVSLITYWIGLLVKKRFRLALFNPLLISVALTIIILLISNILEVLCLLLFIYESESKKFIKI